MHSESGLPIGKSRVVALMRTQSSLSFLKRLKWLLYSQLTSLSQFLQCCQKFLKNLNYRLISYLENKHLRATNQYGFQRVLSTNYAVSTLIQHIVTYLGKVDACLGIYLDISKAFDTVSSNTYIQTLGIENERNSFRKFLGLPQRLHLGRKNRRIREPQ